MGPILKQKSMSVIGSSSIRWTYECSARANNFTTMSNCLPVPRLDHAFLQLSFSDNTNTFSLSTIPITNIFSTYWSQVCCLPYKSKLKFA